MFSSSCTAGSCWGASPPSFSELTGSLPARWRSEYKQLLCPCACNSHFAGSDSQSTGAGSQETCGAQWILALKAASWLGLIMAHCDSNLRFRQRFTMAIYPPMAFGISIIAFTLQLVREKDAVFQLASTSCRKTLPPFIAYYSWIMLVAKSTCTYICLQTAPGGEEQTCCVGPGTFRTWCGCAEAGTVFMNKYDRYWFAS